MKFLLLFKYLMEEINFICDTMLHRLGKLMRSCGIDTAISCKPSLDEYVRSSLREKRYILSRGSMVQKLRKHVDPTFCVDIVSDNPNKQILQVVKHFNIQVKEEDIFSRCQICNSNRFHRLERDKFLRVRSSESKNLTETFPEPEIVTHSKPVKSWSIIEAPGDIIQNKVTSKGIRIKVNDVPEGVASSHLFFYICVECGKCYWEGSHLDKVINGCLKEVLSWGATIQKGN